MIVSENGKPTGDLRLSVDECRPIRSSRMQPSTRAARKTCCVAPPQEYLRANIPISGRRSKNSSREAANGSLRRDGHELCAAKSGAAPADRSTLGPLWVIFDRFNVALRCPVTPRKRTSGPLAFMSTRPSGIVSGTTTFVIPSGGPFVALIVAQTGAVRWRDDGIASTPTNGVGIQPTQAAWEYAGDIAALKFIGVTGTVAVDAAVYRAAS
jgi:hypothetical protein